MKNKLFIGFSCMLAILLGVTSCNPNPTTSTTDTTTPIIENSLLTGEIPSNAILGKGDQMYDYTFIDIDENEHKISHILEEKDLFVINLFASWCGPCATEMPALQEAYALYQDTVEVLALSIEATDTIATLKTKFQERYGLTFPIVLDTYSLGSHFFQGSVSIPKTIFIDRYGTIVDVHDGSIISRKGWTNIFDKYIGDNYVPPVFDDNPTTGNPSDDPVTSAPSVDKEMPASSEIEAVINDSSYKFGYSEETGNDAEYSWPWIISNDGKSIIPSNSYVDGSFAIIHSDFEVTDLYNNVLAFDYLSSCENGYDILYVLVDGVIVDQITGEDNDWSTCYAYVPSELGEHRLSLVYQKDEAGEAGDDCVYVKNMRFINVNDIKDEVYVKRYAPSGLNNEGHYTQYQELVLNKEDGYYHIGSENGPLILAELNKYTPFTTKTSVYGFVVEGKAVVNGVDYGPKITEYAQYGNNNELGLTPVTEELRVALEAVINFNGDNPSSNQWQEVCYYYDVYGPNPVQLPSPIYGLAYFDAIPVDLNEEIEIEFDRVILPRGKYAEFIPEESGVYRVNTISEDMTYGSIIDEDLNVIEESTPHNFIQTAIEPRDEDLIMHAYMEAGKSYYIRTAFYFPDMVGSYKLVVSYIGEEYDFLTLAADSTAFTTSGDEFDVDDPMNIISPSIDIVLKDGIYYHDLGNGEIGSPIYADLLNYSSMFTMGPNPVSIKEIVEQGGANLEFYTETGDYVGAEDLTSIFNIYISLAESSISEDNPYGLIQVDESLGYALQRLMDGWTFYGVENSWLKLCYYYKHYGPTV